MKKYLLKISAALFAAMMTVSLVSCGEDKTASDEVSSANADSGVSSVSSAVSEKEQTAIDLISAASAKTDIKTGMDVSTSMSVLEEGADKSTAAVTEASIAMKSDEKGNPIEFLISTSGVMAASVYYVDGYVYSFYMGMKIKQKGNAEDYLSGADSEDILDLAAEDITEESITKDGELTVISVTVTDAALEKTAMDDSLAGSSLSDGKYTVTLDADGKFKSIVAEFKAVSAGKESNVTQTTTINASGKDVVIKAPADLDEYMLVDMSSDASDASLKDTSSTLA